MTGAETKPEIDEGSAMPQSRHPALHRLIQIGRILVSLAVLAAVGYTAATEWSEVRATIDALSWRSLIAAQAAVLIGMLVTVKIWQHLLAAMGTKIHYRGAAEVNLIGQLGKYLPGSVWAFVLQTQLGKRYRIPRARALVALVLSAGVTAVTGLSLAAFVAAPLSRRWGPLLWLLALGPLTLLTLIPVVLTRISNVALRAMRRPLFEVPLIGSEILRATLWSFLAWLFFGTQLWLLIGSQAKHSVHGYTVCIGAFALAMTAGLVAFIVPSGVGVREAVIVTGLSSLAPSGPALAIALTSRLLFTIGDVGTACLATVSARLTGQRGSEVLAITAHQPGQEPE